MTHEHQTSPVSAPVEPALLRQFTDISETLLNLIYLTKLEAERPEQVRKYMTLSEDRMRVMIETLRDQAHLLPAN